MSAEKFALERSGERGSDEGIIAQSGLYVRRIVDVQDGIDSGINLANANVIGISRTDGIRSLRYVVDIPIEQKPPEKSPQLEMNI